MDRRPRASIQETSSRGRVGISQDTARDVSEWMKVFKTVQEKLGTKGKRDRDSGRGGMVSLQHERYKYDAQWTLTRNRGWGFEFLVPTGPEIDDRRVPERPGPADLPCRDLEIVNDESRRRKRNRVHDFWRSTFW